MTNAELPTSTTQETVPSPESLPSPEEIEDLRTRFDAIVDSPFFDKSTNPKFLRETDPETGEVTTRTVETFGHQTGSSEYELQNDQISFITRPDIIGAEPLSVDAPPEKQRAFMESMLHRMQQSQEVIDKKQAARDEYAHEFGPKVGSKILKAIGIKRPYNKRQERYERIRKGGSPYASK